MKKTFESFLLLCIAAMMFVACDEKDNFEPEGSEWFEADNMDLAYEANPRAFALKFTDFIGNGAENIQRLDEDTVRIAIKDGLLLYLGIGELKEGDVLNIWQNIDCPPYIRVVDAAEKTPSGYIVTTHAGSMGDLFHTFEGCLIQSCTVRSQAGRTGMIHVPQVEVTNLSMWMMRKISCSL